MNINVNYIINTWNLTSIKNIDFEKCYIVNVNGIPILHLYTITNIVECPHCRGSSFNVRSSREQKIKHVLSNQSYAEITFHKRIYKCDLCCHCFSDSLGDFVSSRGVSIYLELAILESIKNLSLTSKTLKI